MSPGSRSVTWSLAVAAWLCSGQCPPARAHEQESSPQATTQNDKRFPKYATPVRFLLNDPHIQDELELSREIRDQIQRLTGNYLENEEQPKTEMQRRVELLLKDEQRDPQKFRGDRGIQLRQAELRQYTESWKGRAADYERELLKLLTDRQSTRLTQVNWQLLGAAGFYWPEMIRTLQLTEEQIDRLNKIRADSSPAVVEIQNALKSGRETKRSLLQKRRELEQRLLADSLLVLSDEQTEKYLALCGRPILFGPLDIIEELHGPERRINTPAEPAATAPAPIPADR